MIDAELLAKRVGAGPPSPNRFKEAGQRQMPIPFIIGAGSGLISAALFASAATATALAGMLFYLAPLPLCLAGLGWGGKAALVSALTGTSRRRGLGPATAASSPFPSPRPRLCSLISRCCRAPSATPHGQVIGALEWYPPGRLVGWAALIAGLLAGLLVLILGYDADAIASRSASSSSTAR